MPETFSRDQVKRIAGLELNALRLAGVLPAEIFEGARITSAGTVIHDTNGEPLFRRVPVSRGRNRVGYSDIAINPALGGPLLAVSHGVDWNEREIRGEAIEAARRQRRKLSFDKVRFVAYSYPKIALQFLDGDEEALMLEWKTWEVVKPQRDEGRKQERRKRLEPSNFERWSLLDELPPQRKRSAEKKLDQRLELYEEPRLRRLDPTVISKEAFTRAFVINLTDTREIHYSTRKADHHVCYELRGQQTNVWCVGASVQMILDFYRYEYSQVRLAQELGLGTLSNPNGLPYARVGDVVTVLEKLSSKALDATMLTNPSFTAFQNEIKANRPLISFVPGHSRTVVGYTRNLFSFPGSLAFRGLLVYDPWPPNAGVITRWENFDTQIYQYAYSSVVSLV